MPLVIVYTVDKDRQENCWMVDEVLELQNQELSLHRSGKHVITLGLADYENGLCIIDPNAGDDEDEVDITEYMTRPH